MHSTSEIVFFYTRKHTFGSGYAWQLCGSIPQDGGILMLAGLAPSNEKVGSLLRPPCPLASKAGYKAP